MSTHADGTSDVLSIEMEFVAKWNATNGVVNNREKSLTKKRSKSFRNRLKDSGWEWKAAIEKFPLKCVASDPNGWKPDIDWFLKPDSVTKILEGKYDWTKSDGNGHHDVANSQQFQEGSECEEPSHGF